MNKRLDIVIGHFYKTFLPKIIANKIWIILAHKIFALEMSYRRTILYFGKARERYVEYNFCMEKLTEIGFKEKRCLDVGCGDSLFSHYLSSKEVCNIELIDLERHISHLCFGDNYHIGDIITYPFQDSSFDIIYMISTIEHIPDDIKVMKKLSQILKINGLLLVTTPISSEFYNKVSIQRLFDIQKLQLIEEHYVLLSRRSKELSLERLSDITRTNTFGLALLMFEKFPD